MEEEKRLFFETTKPPFNSMCSELSSQDTCKTPPSESDDELSSDACEADSSHSPPKSTPTQVIPITATWTPFTCSNFPRKNNWLDDGENEWHFLRNGVFDFHLRLRAPWPQTGTVVCLRKGNEKLTLVVTSVNMSSCEVHVGRRKCGRATLAPLDPKESNQLV